MPPRRPSRSSGLCTPSRQVEQALHGAGVRAGFVAGRDPEPHPGLLLLDDGEHRLGELVIERGIESESHREIPRVHTDVDHCEAGGYLARDWGFSEELREAIVLHHAVPPPAGDGLPAIVNLACRLADSFGFRVATPEVAWSLDELREGLPDILKRAWQPDLAHLAEQTAREVEATLI